MAKVHVDDIEDLRKENSKLRKSIDALKERLASEEPKEGQAFRKNPNSVETESESNGLTQFKFKRYKLDHCSFVNQRSNINWFPSSEIISETGLLSFEEIRISETGV